MSKQKQKRLTQHQRYQLIEWMKANVEHFGARTQPEVAKLAEETLGFPVSHWSVLEIARDFGLSWGQVGRTRAPQKNDGAGAAMDLCVEVEGRVGRCEATLKAYVEVINKQSEAIQALSKGIVAQGREIERLTEITDRLQPRPKTEAGPGQISLPILNIDALMGGGKQ